MSFSSYNSRYDNYVKKGIATIEITPTACSSTDKYKPRCGAFWKIKARPPIRPSFKVPFKISPGYNDKACRSFTNYIGKPCFNVTNYI